MQALLRAYDYNFAWDATRGKPRAATSEGMEGQDKIEAGGFDAIKDEDEVDVQHIFYEIYSSIFIRSIPSPIFMSLLFSSFIFVISISSFLRKSQKKI